MRILLVTTHLNIGGIGRYVTDLAKALKQRGHEIFVASNGGELKDLLLQGGMEHIYLDIKTKSELSPKIIRSSLTLKSFLRQQKIDLIHAHTRVTQVVSALLFFFTGIPYVTTCHGFFKRRLGRRIFGCWGERTIAISKAVKDQLIHDFGVKEKKIVLIHTGIEVNRFLKEIPRSERQHLKLKWGLGKGPVIGAIGRLSPVKGQGILIKATKFIIHDFLDAKVLLVGDGPDEKRLKELSSSLALDKYVIFAGSIDDTAKALSIIDIFVQPSLKEGLGLSLIEAMASGKPCIASKVGGIESLIEDGVTGVLVKPGDYRELARAIKNTIGSKNLVATFRENGRKKILCDFTVDKMTAKVEKMYEEVVVGREVKREHLTCTEQVKCPHKDSRKKILIINVNWLGDVIFSSPFIRSIREAYPHSYIACVTPPRCKDILAANSRLNELIILDEDGPEKSFLGKMKFAMKLREEKFDIAFILHRSFTRALMTVLAGIKERVGYDTKRRGILLTKKLILPSRNIHKVEYFLKFAEAVGADTSKKDYEFFITEPDRIKSDHILEIAGVSYNDRIVVLNPGANWNPKRWPTDRFSQLADALVEKYSIKIVITGAEKDRILAGEISNHMKNKAISICGKTNIRELAAVLERAKLVISGDSGPMHIAVSVRTNVIALFGPTSAEITGPYGTGNYDIMKRDMDCEIPCYNSSCNDNRCMKAITVENVMATIEDRGYLS